MDFTEAMKMMESGKTIKRIGWNGCLFLDIDDVVKYAGEKNEDKEFWILDTHNKDWEENMTQQLNKEEITEARMEALMDSNQSHIKRLYYLEEIIEGQHKALKKLADNFVQEMDETRTALSTMVKSVPAINEKIKNLSLDRDEIIKILQETKILRKDINTLILSTNKKDKMNDENIKNYSNYLNKLKKLISTKLKGDSDEKGKNGNENDGEKNDEKRKKKGTKKPRKEKVKDENEDEEKNV